MKGFQNEEQNFDHVKCRIQWQNEKDDDGKLREVRDSIHTYQEIREKAPLLLVNFFERKTSFI